MSPLLPRSPAPPDRYIHEKSGIELIRIPAGPFLFGDNKETVELPEYWIGRYPVTNAQYKRFVDATGHRAPSHWKENAPPPDKLDHPVVYINWYDAQALAEWAGLRLPTEQEWEKAARGTDGRLYPWGNEEPTAERCNFNKNVGDTTPVGKYSPKGDSPYGCADMAGNVWEWSASLYEQGKGLRVLKGGAYYTSDASSLRGAYRNRYNPDYDNRINGARLAVSPSS
ncbi:formylglycine-generating enzyme family protein [Promineifilum sp.]|uniref:formylglycine-generating enzyme family protein n=1 Tax=Promineifilum sp. TaxID=2664178 RepID=UPI0035B0031C